jgi:hypothetical protein
MSKSRILPLFAVLPAIACLLALGARAAGADAGADGLAIQSVKTETRYAAAGETVRGKVVLRAGQAAQLVVTVARAIEVPSGKTAELGKGLVTETVLKQAVAAGPAPVEVPFAIETKDLLVGSLRIKAELSLANAAAPLAMAWSEPVAVGVRKRLSLAGDWTVAEVKVWEPGGPVPERVDNWKLGATPKTVALPGGLPFDAGFRGWVTLKREVIWSEDKNLQPRALYLAGVTDSVAATVAGEALPETLPVEDLDYEMTRWVEFHSSFKGFEAEARHKRSLLLYRQQDPPTRLPLAKGLAGGKAEVALTIRGTSGNLFGGRRPYGIAEDVRLEFAPAVNLKAVAFDTEKTGEKRKFKFSLTVGNESGKEFKGKLRAVYGRYDGALPYTGDCLPYAVEEQAVVVPAAGGAVAVVHEESPRFDTCRGTFVLLGAKGEALDALAQDFHTVTMEIRNRRELYLNNERFIMKGQGSNVSQPYLRWQYRLLGGMAMRGPSDRDYCNQLMSEGLLSSAGAALFASCEKCIFWNPQDTSNITKAARQIIRHLGQCPGVIEWEVTNEMFGETDECRVAIQEAFHRFDPYHRPIVATKGGGEWEAVAKDGRVAGVDIVGCQYLNSKEGIDSITAAVTEQPLMCTEINWNDPGGWKDPAVPGKNLWRLWLEKGVTGSLLFDYDGNALEQPVPLVAVGDNEDWRWIRQCNREMYLDFTARAVQQPDGGVAVIVGNRMPYALHQLAVGVQSVGRLENQELAPGDQLTLVVPAALAPPARQTVVVRAEYQTHGGLPRIALLTPTVEPAPQGDRK